MSDFDRVNVGLWRGARKIIRSLPPFGKTRYLRDDRSARVGNSRYVFNIKWNSYKLVVVAVFFAGTLAVRFVGTHAEYDRIDASTV